MSDIAQRVGTSATSVSFVLNDLAREKGVSSKLERRIRKAAQEMNYRPSLLARSLAGTKTMVIGAVFPDLSQATASQYLRDIQAQAHDQGYQVMVAQHGGDPARLVSVVGGFLDRRIDGLILVPTVGVKALPMYRELRESGIALVFIDRDPDDPEVSFVSFDGESAVEMSVSRLAGLDHRRISLLNAAPELPQSRRRKMAYRTALEQLHVAFDPLLYREARLSDNPEQGAERVGRDVADLLALPDPPTAMVAISADRAITVYQAVTACGRRIPEDVSLVAATGRQFTGFDRARITSARFSYENVGYMAFKMLWDQIHDKAPPTRVYLPPVFVEGDTVSAPPAGSQ